MFAPKPHQTANSTPDLVQKNDARPDVTTRSVQRDPLVQQASRLSNAPNPSAHATPLNRAPANQQSSNQQLLLQLQRQYGNGYVNQVMQLARCNGGQTATASTQRPFVQAKLTVNPAGDRYEQEADRVADQVVQRMNAPAAAMSGEGKTIQRQDMPAQEDEEEKVTQTKPEISALQRQEMTPEPEEEEEMAQTKPEISALQRQEVTPEPDEEEEMAQTKSEISALQRQEVTPEPDEEEKKVQTKPEISALQRQEMTPEPDEEEETAQTKPEISALQRQADQLIQMKSANPSQDQKAATADLESSVQTERGRGQPIKDSVRGQLEQGFGADFSGVRVHTDSKSDELNQSIQARAFTTGQDIFFRQGAYDTSSKQGQQLLAHELTHVVQQSGGAVQAKSEVNLVAKDSKIQRKASPGASSTRKPSPRQEKTDEKTELDKQSEPTQPTQKTDTAAAVGQPQPPADAAAGGNQPPAGEGAAKPPTVGGVAGNQPPTAGGEAAATPQATAAAGGGVTKRRLPQKKTQHSKQSSTLLKN